MLRQEIQQGKIIFSVLALLPGGEYIGDHMEARLFQAFFSGSAMERVDIGFADNAGAPAPDAFCRLLPQIMQQAASNQDLIIP